MPWDNTAVFYLLIKSKGLQSSLGCTNRAISGAFPANGIKIQRKWHQSTDFIGLPWFLSKSHCFYQQREKLHYSWSHRCSTFHLWRNMHMYIYIQYIYFYVSHLQYRGVTDVLCGFRLPIWVSCGWKQLHQPLFVDVKPKLHYTCKRSHIIWELHWVQAILVQ